MEKVCRRRSAVEGSREKVHERRAVGEGPLEKSAGEGLLGKRDVDGIGLVGKRVVAGKEVGKGVLIPCEEKNNSLIFIN